MGTASTSGRRRRVRLAGFASLVALVIGAALAACGGGTSSPAAASAAPASVAPVSAAPASAANGGAGGTCPWLTPADFTAAGIPGAGAPSDNPDGAGSHYCVYAGKSGATGGIELDVFTHGTAEDAKTTYDTAVSEVAYGSPVSGGAFDASSWADDGKVASLVVRKGTTVVVLAVPSKDGVQAALVGLATLALGRAGS